MRLHYRTIGQSHGGASGNTALGSFDSNGRWLGHLVVVVDGTLIDPTIGQLNDPKFTINFDPPGLTAPVTEAFLSGQEPLIFMIDGMLVAYFAYPDERTFEASKSWSDPEFRAQLQALGERTAAPFQGQESSKLHSSD